MNLYIFTAVLLGLNAITLFIKSITIHSLLILQWEILSIARTPIHFRIIIDQQGLIFASVVRFISANVIFFATTYIKYDHYKPRFLILVLLFVLSINFFIFSSNLFRLLLGWDGLGLTSFILVIYYQNKKSLGAGIITALSNRIGDVRILIAIALCLNQGHWLFNTLITDHHFISTICICILLAGITKRAQIPFSRWLPAAIAAPTPVSALVHSSTLVTAGVFILIRFYPRLSYSPSTLLLLLFISIRTLYISRISAIYEIDIKKIIALSTLRQLSLIIIAIAITNPTIAFFHLITHAIFKALLFLCAGTIIFLYSHNQDLRMFGNSVRSLPITNAALLISSSALIGIPFLSGFYSKDLIIELSIFGPQNLFVSILLLFSITLTSIYSLRLLSFASWSINLHIPSRTNSINIHIILSTSFISLGAVLVGASLSWLLPLFSSIPISQNLKLTPFLLTILFSILYLRTRSKTKTAQYRNQKLLLNRSNLIWFLTPISTHFTISSTINQGVHLISSTEGGWLELGQLSSKSAQILNSTISYFLSVSSTTRFLITFPFFVILIFPILSCLDSLNKT